MPIEREFGELDFRRIQQGCKRMAKKAYSVDCGGDRQSKYSNRKEGDLIPK